MPEQAEPFDEEQLERLGAAADLAEASGAETALMLIDGRGALMDVPNRTVIAELAAGVDPVARVDAAVYVATDDDLDGAATIGVPRAVVMPPQIAAQFEALGIGPHDQSSNVNPPEEV